MPPQIPNPAHLLRFLDEENTGWSTLLQRTAPPIDPATLAEPFTGKRVLITGAGGSIGSALALCIANFQPEHLTLLDSSEHSLYELQNELAELPDPAPHDIVPGSVCDSALLNDLLTHHRPQIVYHAAAYKHVPLMEHHPRAALQTNAIGTHTLTQTCLQANVAQLILLSTDKAVAPASIMGASKRIAELILLAHSNGPARMKALRLGNVLGSRGSVVPLFQKQIARGGPVTVTHPEVRRYFLPLRQSVELLLALAQPAYASGIFIPNLDPPIRILDLANFLIHNAAVDNIPINFTGLRPGDKMHEELLSPAESLEPASNSAPLHKVISPHPAPAVVNQALHQLAQAVHHRDTALALEVLHRLLPQYHPGELLRPQAAHPVNAL